MKIGVVFGNPETTTGGNALKFYSSVRLDIRRIGAIKEGQDIVGNRTRVKVVKNKVAPPFKEAEVVITAAGIDREENLVNAALNAGLITRSGSFFKIGEKILGQGKEEAKQVISKNAKLKEQLMKQILNKKS